MTGRFLFKTEDSIEASHTHVVFSIKSKNKNNLKFLHYIDPRRFGFMTYHKGELWQQHPLLSPLGVEPLECKNLAEELWKKSRKRKTPIKNFIMDASTVVGVGNIYACEALFLASIKPTHPAGKLNKEKYSRLALSICKVLKKAIQNGGSSIKDFRTSSGENGYFQVHHNVYGKSGEPCKKCQQPIKQMKQAGRSTWFCTKCQL